MPEIENLNVSGKKVIVRVDYNVPLNKSTNEVTDKTRIEASMPTVKYLINQGAKVILMAHLGRPKNNTDSRHSLKNVLPVLEELLGKKVLFVDDCTKGHEAADTLQNGDVMLLENLRYHAAEEQGEPNFAAQLAAYGEYYINDAFGAAHRAHASTSIIANYFEKDKKAFGYLMEKEVKSAEKLLQNPARPIVAIIGGAKVSDKIGLIENLINKVDTILIGGGMAFTFLKALGHEIGTSLCENDSLEIARKCWDKAKANNVNLQLPIDSVCASAFSNEVPHATFSNYDLPADVMGLDIGEATIAAYSAELLEAKSILWNGPMGVFEMSNYAHGTEAIAKAVAAATEHGAFSVVGGGDSVAALHQCNLAASVSHVSTGGGALLELFEGKTLPGIAAMG
jgi:phosphoglycerate kinase